MRPPFAVDLLTNCPNSSLPGIMAAAPAAAKAFKTSRRVFCLWSVMDTPSYRLKSIVAQSLTGAVPQKGRRLFVSQHFQRLLTQNPETCQPPGSLGEQSRERHRDQGGLRVKGKIRVE